MRGGLRSRDMLTEDIHGRLSILFKLKKKKKRKTLISKTNGEDAYNGSLFPHCIFSFLPITTFPLILINSVALSVIALFASFLLTMVKMS